MGGKVLSSTILFLDHYRTVCCQYLHFLFFFHKQNGALKSGSAKADLAMSHRAFTVIMLFFSWQTA